VLLLINIQDDNYDDNESETSTVNVSMSTRCGTYSGCDGRGGHQMWSVTGNKELTAADIPQRVSSSLMALHVAKK